MSPVRDPIRDGIPWSDKEWEDWIEEKKKNGCKLHKEIHALHLILKTNIFGLWLMMVAMRVVTVKHGIRMLWRNGTN